MSDPRPRQLVVVAGTGTEIGKTWVTCAVTARLRAHGHQVSARKPAQSYAPGEGPGEGPAEGPTDADLLAAATGEAPADVCPAHRWYPAPLAPPMAAEHLDRPPVRLAGLVEELRWPAAAEVGLVETAGGVASPQAEDATVPELVAALGADRVLLVADAGLGTINAVRLSVAALGPAAPVHVFLNRFDPAVDLHRRNVTWLRSRDGFDVSTGVDELLTVCAPR